MTIIEPAPPESMQVLGRRMAKFSGYAFFSSLLLQFLTVIQSIVVIRLLGRGDYGLLSIVGYVLVIMGLAADLGMSLGIVRLVSDARVRAPETVIGIETTYFWLVTASTAAMMAVLLVATPLLAGNLYQEPRLVPLFLIATVSLGFSGYMGAISPILQAHQRIPTLSKLSVLVGVINIPLVLGCAYLWRVPGVLIAGVVGGSVALLINTVVFRDAVRRRMRRIRVFSRRIAKELLSMGGPTMLAGVLSTLGVWMGATVLQTSHGLANVGLYAAASGVAGLILFVQSAVVVPFVPAATEQYAKGMERLERTTAHTIRYIIVFVFPLCLIAVLFGKEILTLLYGSDFASAALPLGLLACVSLLLSYAGPAGYVYYALKLMRRLAALNLIWFTLLVVAVFLLVPSGSVEGLALATLVVFLIHLHIGLILIRKKYRIATLYTMMCVTEVLAIGLAGLALLAVGWAFSVRFFVALVILAAYGLVLEVVILGPRDKVFLIGLVSTAVGRIRGTSGPAHGSSGADSLYEAFHRGTQAPTALVTETDFTYGNPLTFIRRHLPEGGRVLDVGCGNGVLSLYAATRGREVLAIDVSKRAVEAAAQGALGLGIGNVTFRQLDFSEFQPDGQFDAILCFDVLEHIPDDDRGIETIARSLRPGGILLLRVPSPNALVHRLKIALFGRDAFDETVGHLRRYTPEILCEKLTRHGFRVIEVEPVEGPVRNFLFTTRFGQRLLAFAVRHRLARVVTSADNCALRAFGDSGFNLAAVFGSGSPGGG